jgi:hypothetical protein
MGGKLSIDTQTGYVILQHIVVQWCWVCALLNYVSSNGELC